MLKVGMTIIHIATPKDTMVLSTALKPFFWNKPYWLTYGCLVRQLETGFEPLIRSVMDFIGLVTSTMMEEQEDPREVRKGFKLLRGGKTHKDRIDDHKAELLAHLEDLKDDNPS